MSGKYVLTVRIAHEWKSRFECRSQKCAGGKKTTLVIHGNVKFSKSSEEVTNGIK